MNKPDSAAFGKRVPSYSSAIVDESFAASTLDRSRNFACIRRNSIESNVKPATPPTQRNGGGMRDDVLAQYSASQKYTGMGKPLPIIKRPIQERPLCGSLLP